MGYVDKEALLVLLSKFTESAWFKENHPWALDGFKVAAEEVKKFPESDVIEIVRCKDCKYWNSEDGYCKGIGNWFETGWEWNENDYCSRYKKLKRIPYINLDSVINTVYNLTEKCDTGDIIDLRDMIVQSVKDLAAINFLEGE